MILRADDALGFTDDFWERHALPTLMEYVSIPCLSPAFDPDWRRNGHLEDAVSLIKAWCKRHTPDGTELDVLQSAGRTPVLLVDIPGTLPGHVFLYGHLDKQPPLEGWRSGLGPWLPVREGERLYGRGSADDGYAVFAAVGAVALLAAQGIPYPRCTLLIECSEESGSPDLPHYLQTAAERIGSPDLVVCLDSGAGDYDRLWITTSLRGLIGGTLTVRVLREGVHSGDGGGVVPSSFRIAGMLLDRIEDRTTGQICKEFQTEIPPHVQAQLKEAAEALGQCHYDRFPLLDGIQTLGGDTLRNLCNRTWRPALEITGAGGLPALEKAGNVLRPFTALKLSLRLPPTLDGKAAGERLVQLFQCNPPFGADVEYQEEWGASGWVCAPFDAWLKEALQDASTAFYGHSAVYSGEGFAIPFLQTLINTFPKAQFVVTGVLGPSSNAHGVNEFLHLGMVKRVTACIGEVIGRVGLLT